MTVAQVTLQGLAEFRNVSPELEAWLRRESTFPNPRVTTLERLGKHWTHLPRHLSFWRPLEGGGIAVPRALWPLAVARSFEASAADVIDRRATTPLPSPVQFAGNLNDVQRQFVDRVCECGEGVGVGPTATGKTVIACAVISRLQRATLIIVPNLALALQWEKQVREHLGVECGRLAGGRRALAPITVATVQALSRRPLTRDEAAGYGLVIADEVHRYPTERWAGMLSDLPAKCRIGLTATPTRKDGLQAALFKILGPIIAETSVADARRVGRTVPFDVAVIESQFQTPSREAGEWRRAVAALARDAERNRLITSEVRRLVAAGRRCLVLCEFVDHVELLAAELEDCAPLRLHGRLSPRDRSAGLERLRRGAPHVTVATIAAAGEGLDAPALDALLLASPNNNPTRTTQAVGRVVRSAPGKTRALVVDVVDRRVEMFASAAKKRSRVYADLQR